MRFEPGAVVNVSPLFEEGLNFTLPHELEAGSPPEARGLARDEVRLMVSSPTTGTINHSHFRDLPDAVDNVTKFGFIEDQTLV